MKSRLLLASMLALGALGSSRTIDLAHSGLAGPAKFLTNPPVLENLSTVPGVVEVKLTAAPARVSMLPGKTTDVFAGCIGDSHWGQSSSLRGGILL